MRLNNRLPFDKVTFIGKLLLEYNAMANILKDYITNPIAVATMLASRKCSSVTDEANNDMQAVFQNVSLGLKGDFTKEKALEIGKQKIIGYLSLLLETITKDYITKEELSIQPYEVLKSNLTVVYNTCDIDILKKRKEQYMGSEMTINFLTRRALGIISDTAKWNMSDTDAATSYLNKLADTLNVIFAGVNFDHFKKLIDVHHSVHEIINTHVSSDDNEFNLNIVTTNVNITPLEVLEDSMEILNKLILKTEKTDTTENSLVSVLNALIDSTSSRLNTIEQLLEGYRGICNNINVDKESFIKHLTTLHTNTVTAYANSTITLNEYEHSFHNYMKGLELWVNEDYNLSAGVVNQANSIDMLINVYLVTYVILDKITTAGTLETNISVS